jgi:hypothetical protein
VHSSNADNLRANTRTKVKKVIDRPTEINDVYLKFIYNFLLHCSRQNDNIAFCLNQIVNLNSELSNQFDIE